MKKNFIDKIHHSFIQHADKSAIWVDHQFYTYSDFYKKIKRLADFFKKIEQSNAVFFILSEKTIKFYEAMIASFFSGFIYTPININEGFERNQKILEMANPDIIFIGTVNIQWLLTFLLFLPRKKIVISDYDMYKHLISIRIQHDLFYFDPVSEIENYSNFINFSYYAYLFFTSGSTGVPKGVPISYHNLNAYIEGVTRIFTLHAGDNFIQMSDIAFDISIHEVLISLLSGGTLYVYNEQHELNITRFFIDKKIEHCFLVPSTMKIFLDQCNFYRSHFPALKITLVCGESFVISLAKKWKKIATNSLIANLYGPTETTIACSYHIFDERNNYGHLLTVPIGLPFLHVQLEVTDSHELIIMGRQVTNRYWLDDSNSRFYLDPLLNKNAYLTGDIVSYDNRFGYIFLGRLDDQWQIQGYRIEKVEIESVLRLVCDVHDMVVAPHYGDHHLIDFLIAYSTTKVNLNQHPELLLHLPKAAIPKKVIALQSIPKLLNGKINYKELNRLADEEMVC